MLRIRNVFETSISDSNTDRIRNTTTVPSIFEIIKPLWLGFCEPYTYAFGDLSDLQASRHRGRVGSERSRREFMKGNYSYSVLQLNVKRQIMPVAIFHQENVDPRSLVKILFSQQCPTGNGTDCDVPFDGRRDKRPGQMIRVSDWFSSRRRKWDQNEGYGHKRLKQASSDGRHSTHRKSTGNGLVVSWEEDQQNYAGFEEMASSNFDGLFYFVIGDALRGRTHHRSELKISFRKQGIYSVEVDKKVIGVAIDFTDTFGDALICGVLFRSSFRSHFALAVYPLKCNVLDFHGRFFTPIQSVVYGDTYRSFYNDGHLIDNSYYCLDATTDSSYFSVLPDTIFVKILLHLRLEEQSKCRRVNRRWRRICDLAIRIGTYRIDFHWNMGAEERGRLLAAVSGVLEELTWCDCDVVMVSPETFLRIPDFPKLRAIDLGNEIPDYDSFISLLERCPNLRELTAVVPSAPSGTNCSSTYNVEKLIVPAGNTPINAACMLEIISRFPTLTYFRCDNETLTATILSMVVEKYAENLIRLQVVHPEYPPTPPGTLLGMGRCSSLEYLSLVSTGYLSDSVMADIATGCSRLTTLDLTRSSMVTSEGLAMLASLPNLSRLNISNIEDDLSFGLCQIAEQGRLEQVIAEYTSLSTACLETCVRYCRRLILFDVYLNTMFTEFTMEDATRIVLLYDTWSLSPRLVFCTDSRMFRTRRITQLRREITERNQHRFVVYPDEWNHRSEGKPYEDGFVDHDLATYDNYDAKITFSDDEDPVENNAVDHN